MTELEKKLAIAMGYGDALYRDSVREEIRNKMSYSDEIAILRKAVAILFNIVATLHSDDLKNEEFAKYNALIESIKSEKKEEILKGEIKNDNN